MRAQEKPKKASKVSSGTGLKRIGDRRTGYWEHVEQMEFEQLKVIS